MLYGEIKKQPLEGRDSSGVVQWYPDWVGSGFH